MADPTASTFLQAMRVLCASLMASLVIILVAVTVVLSSGRAGAAPLWSFAVVVAVGAGEATLIRMFGYRFTPVAPGTPEADARRDVVAQVQSRTIIRFALAEAVAIVSLALAFVVSAGGVYLVILGVLIAEVLMLVHVWPSETLLARVQERLESQGGRSYLREALAAPPPGRPA